jgi:3'-phosphoadenosine 5'-phosphosulfate sulfotransferase (PAPS reductase)/FAD synthetase
MNKIIGWFSGGVTSAVAIKKAIEAGHNVTVFYMETGSHHPDHSRFINDCERWYGQKIITMKNKKYVDAYDVVRKNRFINGPSGAKCTNELKKFVRQQIEKYFDYDMQVFGFEYEKSQINRAIRFQEQYPEAVAVFPLIELNMTKEDCFNVLIRAGIEIPAMYKLGYSNSNCIGCVKGGQGYWNKIRVDFPETFEAMATIERSLKRSCINGIFLDELDPGAGRHEDISLPECGGFCQLELSGLKQIDDVSFLKNRLFTDSTVEAL